MLQGNQNGKRKDKKAVNIPCNFCHKFNYMLLAETSGVFISRQTTRRPTPPPPQLPSLAVRRGKIRDNCNILRVGTLDSFRFSIAFLIDSSNGRSNNGSADCNFLLQMCVYGPRPFGQLTHGDIVTKKKFTVATEDKEICIFFHLLKSP